MAEAIIPVAVEIAADHVVDSIATQLGYIWNYKTNFQNLEGQRQKLEGTRTQVKHSVEAEERKGKEIEQKVLSWLDRVGTIDKEATKIIDDNQRANMRCFKSLCPDLKKRYQHSKKAAFKANEVSEVEKERNSLGEISYCTPPKEPWDQFLKDYKDFESRRSIVEKVLKELSNSDVNMVGICGMGGAGKTTLAMVVGKRAEEDKLFDVVIFVEVTEKPDVRNIQGTIAGKLGLELQAETESVIANKLYEQLQKGRKNILLILDNIWEGCFEFLKKVGIPLGGDHRACKLLLTARGIDVLKTEMDCQTYFPVGGLNENDAWALFKKMAGACIELYGLQPIASEVAKRCGGLPIAIVTVAKALKGKQENGWSNALLELERPSLGNLGSVTSETYKCIRLSYNQLNSDELKSIFLLCCTLVFTSNESVEELLRYGMGLNLLNTVCTMGEARNRVNKLIQDLKNSFLLLETFDDEGFSIHDVVRDAGRAIAINDHNKYTVNDDRILQQDLAEENTLKNCTSITFHDISELPEELDCPQLKFLYVKPKTPFSKIPDNFFKGMLNLGVVHLIEMVLSPMPASFHLLKKLQTLNLDRCHLGDIAEIGNLKNLKILVLSSRMEQLPEQIGELNRLMVLDLSKCSDLEVIPPNTISRLTQLEELYMPDWFCKWQVEGVEGERSNGSLGELEHLSKLTALQIYIPDAKLLPKGLLFQKLQRYTLYIGVRKWVCYSSHNALRLLKMEYDDADISVEDGIIKQLKEIEELRLIGKQGGVKNVLYELNRDGFPKLKRFVVERNPELVYIVDFPKQLEPCVAFPHLQTLSLLSLDSLEKICHGQFTLTPNSLCQLRTITVYGCVKLKNIFSSSIARHLSQLEQIEVNSCKNMEEIFSIVGSENEEIVLEKLDSLCLQSLAKLRSFSYEEEVGSTCDEERQMKDSLMPLFDGKVKFRNLKTIFLKEINLKYVFSSSTLGSFVQLQSLYIDNCSVLEEIIRIDDLKNNVELPSLKRMRIKGCPQMKSFIFSDKVTFPSLEEIEISGMDNLEMIRQNQFEDSLNLQCYPKLSKMTVTNCQSLKNLFPASIARNLSQLKQLYVKNCGINAFIFGDKVAFPNLEKIEISDMDNLEMIWDNQLEDSQNVQNCQKLCKVLVKKCQSLKNLFPASIVRNLCQLKDIYVQECGIKEIVAKEEGAEEAGERTFVFPKLTYLSLHNLLELKYFYPGIHTTKWPMLKKLNVIGCDMIDASKFLNIQEVISEDQPDIVAQGKVFSSDELKLSANEIRMILQKFPEHKFSKVEDLEVFDDESTVFPLDILKRFPNLNCLQLSDTSYKEIFSCKEVEKHETLAQINYLRLEKLDDLEQMWKQDSRSDLILHNLESLEVVECNSLITLMPTSASFQNLRFMEISGCNGLRSLVTATVAKSPVQLDCMKVKNCNEMTEIVANGDVKEDEIIFNKLEKLQLTNLSNLTSFYSGNYTLNFPSLNGLQVTRCPKMKFFSSGISSTPMLQQIEWGSSNYNLEGDLNTTIQRIHEEMNVENSTEDCAGPST